ncbi:hypothetical protein P692DRAFT_20486303 [Suillus brevipes Sb2]|nr:hypothetical protein P692DRAFT_20486303 [Suillus brevipes Sb2]
MVSMPCARSTRAPFILHFGSELSTSERIACFSNSCKDETFDPAEAIRVTLVLFVLHLDSTWTPERPNDDMTSEGERSARISTYCKDGTFDPAGQIRATLLSVLHLSSTWTPERSNDDTSSEGERSARSNLYFAGVRMTPVKLSQTFILYYGMTLRDGAASWRGRVFQW